MRGVLKLALMVCLALGLAGVALAQRGGGMGFGANLGGLAMNPGVQKEIKVTDEQGQAQRRAGQVSRGSQGRYGQTPRPGYFREERQKLMKTLNDDTDKTLGKVLDDKQMKRLRQIGLQQQGLRLPEFGDSGQAETDRRSEGEAQDDQ